MNLSVAASVPDKVMITNAGYNGDNTADLLLRLNRKCFGDSITFGYKMHGQGTTQGQPYPAVLNRLLNQ